MNLGWGIHGFFGDPIKKYFDTAKLHMRFKEIPYKRSLLMLEDKNNKGCMAISQEQATQLTNLKISEPFYIEENIIGITRADHATIQNKETLKTLMSNQDLLLMTKEGESYGKELNLKIKEYRPRVYSFIGDTLRMLKMVELARVDYFLISSGEAKSLISLSGLDPKKFKTFSFQNKLHGKTYLLGCSKSVPSTTIEKLNKAIKSVNSNYKY